MKTFDDCLNNKFGFYGIDFNRFKIGKYVFEVIEDEDDGYRSYLDSVIVSENTADIFFKIPLANVIVSEYSHPNDFKKGYLLTDAKDNHVWLEFGTDYSDDYYPLFYMNYYPKKK